MKYRQLLCEYRIFYVPLNHYVPGSIDDTFKVFYMPIFAQMKNIVDNVSDQEIAVRGISKNDEIYIWDAHYGIHHDVLEHLDQDTSGFHEWWIRPVPRGVKWDPRCRYIFNSYDSSEDIIESSPRVGVLVNKLDNVCFRIKRDM